MHIYIPIYIPYVLPLRNLSPNTTKNILHNHKRVFLCFGTCEFNIFSISQLCRHTHTYTQATIKRKCINFVVQQRELELHLFMGISRIAVKKVKTTMFIPTHVIKCCMSVRLSVCIRVWSIPNNSHASQAVFVRKKVPATSAVCELYWMNRRVNCCMWKCSCSEISTNNVGKKVREIN